MNILSIINIKSTLSPNANPLYSPSTIAKKLHQRGIKLAALTDLNSAMNCPAFYTECSKYSIACLFGMDAWTCDGFKTLVLFADLKLALDFCSSWYDTLPDSSTKSSQFYVDENGDIIGEVKKNSIQNPESVLWN